MVTFYLLVHAEVLRKAHQLFIFDILTRTFPAKTKPNFVFPKERQKVA